MAKISKGSQLNYWGRMAPTGYGLDPQRSDLWFADFTTAVLGLRGVAVGGVAPASAVTDLGQLIINATPAVMPQLVKSVALPDTRIRADAIRRGSLPYQTPSWDEPYEPIRVQFIADVPANDAEQGFTALRFLKVWTNMVRLGRGLRFNNGPAPTDPLNLTETADGGLPLPNFRFNFSVFLLKGLPIQSTGSSTVVSQGILSGLAQASVRAATSLANAFRRPDALFASDSDSGFSSLIDDGMSIATTVTFRNAWPASYKITDLTYDSPGLVLVDATFHVEAVSYDDGATWS